MARLFISAVGKSSGKTTLTIGLAAAFARRGLDVRCFKKGPDYIDPMWHAAASGRACFNLDFNAQTRDEILATFGRGAAGGDISLIEGNKGLHDGVDEEGADSSAALAKLLRAPVLLVIDAEGMARGVAPLALGYSAFDRDVTIAGIALNKVGTPRQEGKLRRALERYTDLPVLGAIARDEALDLEERHLGLATPAETAHRDARIDAMAEVVLHNLDLDRVLAIAREAPALAEPAACAPAPVARDVTVAIARDAAFGFYYVDDLEALERAGARLVFFDALRDARLPPADALFVGGGFPETHAEALSANAALRRDVAAALAGGMPAYAECGGLMYLARSIEWRGRRHPMVGAVPADVVMGARPQGRGLVALEATADAPWPPASDPRGRARVPAHEFHYARMENVAPGSRFAWRVLRGHGVDGANDGFVVGNLVAGFAHMRDGARNPWARRFVAFARARKRATAPRRAAAE